MDDIDTRNFTPNALRVLSFAKELAEGKYGAHDLCKRNFIGIDYIFLAICGLEGCNGYEIIEKITQEKNKNGSTVTLGHMQMIVVSETRNRNKLPMDRVTILPEVGKLCVAAAVEAENLGHRYVGTEHLLLAIMAKPQSMAAHIIQTNTGVWYMDMKMRVEQRVGDPKKALERVEFQRIVQEINQLPARDKGVLSGLLENIGRGYPNGYKTPCRISSCLLALMAENPQFKLSAVIHEAPQQP